MEPEFHSGRHADRIRVRVMRFLLAGLWLVGCSASDPAIMMDPSVGVDAGSPPVDAPVVVVVTDAPPPVGTGTAGAACTQGSDCAGGTCLGAAGQPHEGNVRFAGGYCTTLGCRLDSQEGCGADEWCIDGGDTGICVAMCAKSEGLSCAREDHVCLGLGSFGGCFSREAVECTVVDKEGTGCPTPGDLCIKIGFDDFSLGRCETGCDPMAGNCSDGRGCYLIVAYNLPFCSPQGKAKLGEPCECDKCCENSLACTVNDDLSGRTCRNYCIFATGEGCGPGERCKALKKTPDGDPISIYGGCVPD